MADTLFSRCYLKEVVKDVRKHFPGIKVSEAKVYNQFGQHWEFYYKDFTFSMKANDAYEARAKGWVEYLQYMGKE